MIKFRDIITESSAIQNLLDYMISNNIQIKIVRINDNNKLELFKLDMKPYVDKKLLRYKINPVDDKEVRISLGINSISKMNEGLKPTNQIGKRPKKEDILDGKKGRTWVTPKNRRYEFDYEKNGNKYTFIIIYRGHKMKLSEPDYNRTNIDDLLDSMDHGLDIE